MSRKPVNEVKSLQNREAIWAAIRNITGPFSVRELRGETSCTIGQVRDYVLGLTSAEILACDTSAAPRRYRMVRDCGVEAPRVRRDGTMVTQGRGREQMWETMRALGSFTIADLYVSASTDDHPVAASEARIYCATLWRAGYLRKIETGNYQLVKRTGPKPPMIQRTKSVFDPNLNKIVWREDEDHDQK